MKKFLSLSACIALTLSACQPAGSGDTIKIGFIGPLTGDAAAYGVDTLNGAKMKVDEINAAGGINGKQISLIVEDSKCNGADAVSAAQKLANVDKVVGVIGGACSSETLGAAPIFEAAKIVEIGTLSSSPDITKAGDFIFRAYPSDALKTKAMAQYFRSKGFTKVAVIAENTDFCVGFRHALHKHFCALTQRDFINFPFCDAKFSHYMFERYMSPNQGVLCERLAFFDIELADGTCARSIKI